LDNISGKWFDNELKQKISIGANMEKSFFNFFNSNNQLFEPRVVNNFLLSLKTKPFVILTGISGTDKTRLALSFAKWVYENNYKKK